MKKKALFVSLLMMAGICTPQAFAAPKDLGIAAVVDGDAISSYDVDNRIKFIIATSGYSGNPDAIRTQVIHTLIDEKLQIVEAHKKEIKVSEQDVLDAIAGIEAQRGMPTGTIFHILDSKGVPRDTFLHQIQAQLLWHNLLMAKVRPQVHISDEEVDIASRQAAAAASAPQKKAKTSQGSPEYKIAVITLPIDKASKEGEVKAFGEKLVSEIRHGTSFEEMSLQFSSETASAGGKVESFWVKPEQLDPKVAKAMAGGKAGSIAGPVQTATGFTIIKIYDVRLPAEPAPQKEDETPKDSEVYLKEILLKAKADTGSKEADAMLQIGEEVAKHPGTCEEKGVASIQNTDDMDIDVTFARKTLSELPAGVKAIVENLKVGDISTPFASYEGIRLYMLCDKKEVDAKPVDRDAITNMLYQQKMALESQKYLRDLRREAFIDIRN